MRTGAGKKDAARLPESGAADRGRKIVPVRFNPPEEKRITVKRIKEI